MMEGNEMATAPTPEQKEAFDTYRAALAKVQVHDRMKSFETIRAICDRALEWGPEYEAEARLALAYALDDVLDVDQTQIEELEDECRVNHEFGWAYCERKKAYEREWGL
jgi:hypothetical protein